MKRMILWALSMTVAFSFTMPVDGNRALAQRLDPIPIDDEASYESELPLPPQADERSQLRDYSQAYLGVTFDPQVQNAAVARSVNAGSPADQAGVQAGDTIVSLNGRRVSSYQEVLQIVDALRPGQVLDIDISRRVSVRARAVLDGQPVEVRRTADYPFNLRYQDGGRLNSSQYNVNTRRPLPNNSALDNRRGEVNRNNRPTERDRDDRVRARLPRRRN